MNTDEIRSILHGIGPADGLDPAPLLARAHRARRRRRAAASLGVLALVTATAVGVSQLPRLTSPVTPMAVPSISGVAGPATSGAPTSTPRSTPASGTPSGPGTSATATRTPTAPGSVGLPSAPVAAPRTYASVAPAPTVYYVAVGQGTQGCGDDWVGAVAVPASQTPVKDAMTRLLADHNPILGQSGLTNALAASRLTYAKGAVDKANRVVDVWLTGTFSLGGVCDIPRVEAQLELTAASAAGVDKARIWVNNLSLDSVLSLK